jgi:hypothetical protein
MRLRTLLFLAVVVAALVGLGTTVAQAAPGTDRPLQGSTTAIAVVDTAAGTGTVTGSGQLSHLGATTSHTDLVGFTQTGSTFTATGTATFVAANGDEFFTTVTVTGNTTSTGVVSTAVDTITGGTGRFTDASGTFTVTGPGTTVSTVGSVSTVVLSNTIQGHISY